MTRSRFSVGFVAAGAIVLTSASFAPRTAYAQVFDFEDQTATYISPPAGARPGALTSLVLTSGGVTLTLSRPNAARFDIVDNTTDNQNDKPAVFGNRSIDPFFDTAGNETGGTGQNGFIGNFGSLVNNVSLDFGDYEGSDMDADVFTLTAYSGLDGTGTILGSTTIDLGNSGFLNPVAPFPAGYATAAVFASGIRSFTYSSTSSQTGNGNSVFVDNIRVNAAASAAPEPGSLALLLGAGSPALAGGLAFRLRRRKA